MRIVIDAVGIRGHGGAAVLCELLRGFPIARPVWEWHVFLFDRSLREFDDPAVSEQITIEKTRMGNGAFARLTWVNRHLPACLKAIGADLLFSFANIAPACPSIPQVVFCHQLNAFFGEGIPISALYKRARLRFMRSQILRGARASQAMIVQTEAMRNRIVGLEPSLRGRIRVIPSGYRTPSENPDVRLEKKDLIDSATRPQLVYISHPSEHKNHLALVRAMPRIIKTFPSASLLFTLKERWPSNRRYSFFVNEIRKEAEYLNVSRHLVWLGLLNPDEVEYTLRSSNLMVFPSLAESFGLGLVESMAAGCPVAAADLSYAHDVCGDAAVYFNPKDSDSIAKIVTSACSNKATLEQLRTIGTERKNRYSYQKIADEIAQVFESTTE